MKIGVDANHLSVNTTTGLKNYSKNLLTQLSKIDTKNDYYIFVSKKVRIPNRKNFHLVVTPRLLPFIKRQFFLAYFVKKYDVDIFHYLHPYGDVFLDHPKIITTVQDMELNQTYPYSLKYILNRLNCEFTRWVIFKRSKVFLTSSNFTKSELSHYLKRSKQTQPIYKIPYAAEEIFKKDTKTQNKRGFLCLSDFSERKNIETIIQAFNLLPESVKKEHKLTIVSTSEKTLAKHKQLLLKLNLFKFSQILKNISTPDLSKLYNKSICFLYPSLYEGFGLPILEAMASGCPVITTNYGAMKEVAGNAALLVNPHSREEITTTMKSLINDSTLAKKYISRGLKRAKHFSWRNTAKKTLEVYYKVHEKLI